MNKLIYAIIFSIYLNSLTLLMPNIDSSTFLGVNVFIDFLIFIAYLNFLHYKNRYLFPSSMLIFSFYLYSILGKCIWIYRENYWFNELGRPNEIAIYFSVIGIILIIFSTLNLNKFKIAVSATKNNNNNNNIAISITQLSTLTTLCFIGAFLFTNQFKYIPIFEANMDSTRVLLINESEGGRGLGFMLLLFGIIASSMALLIFRKSNLRKKVFLTLIIILNIFFLSLYSGRFLPLIPFVLYFIILKEGQIIRAQVVFRNILIVFFVFFALMYFGAKRSFGDTLDNEILFRFLVGDSFPEFRMTVYGHYLTSNNYFENFFFTILSGTIPSSIFNMVGLNKFDYFKPIGTEILNIMHFDPVSIPGIRTSLFGELSFTGLFIIFFIILIFIIFSKLDRSFLKTSEMNFKKYSLFVISIFIAFSIPYGSLFLIGVLQISIILYILRNYVFKTNKHQI